MEESIKDLLNMAAEYAVFAFLAFLEAARRRFALWMAQRTLMGAVERAAGVALEMERQGNEAAALPTAVNYVNKAVPQALARLGSGTHLDEMVLGQIGVLRAKGGRQ